MAEDVNQRLLELRVRKKGNCHYRQDLKLKIETLLKQISDIKIVIAYIQAELNGLMISS
jgi:hypothetical protein